MKNHQSTLFRTPEDAVSWMVKNRMIMRSMSKDPETLATVRGFTLSDEFGQSIGSSLLELFTKANGSKRNGLRDVTVRDAFLMATIAAILRKIHAPLSQKEMQLCAGILMTLLPIDRLAQAGIADKTLHNLAHDKSLVRKVQRACGRVW
jgi:hypothetical protein